TDVPLRTFGKDRIRFGGAVLARAAALRPHLALLGHVNFARLGPALSVACPSAKVWYLTYGIDVWRRLDAVTRRMLRHASRIVSISDFTRRELARHNGIDAETVSLLPCALDPFWQSDFDGLAVPRPNGHRTLLTVARLALSEKYKGIDSVLAALPE